MELGPFFQNQKPGTNANITVTDPVSNTAVDLTSYTSAELVLAGPDGTEVDTSSGTCTISDAANGIVTYAWPTTTLFASIGDYRWQLKLEATGVEDLTKPATFEVLKRVV